MAAPVPAKFSLENARSCLAVSQAAYDQPSPIPGVQLLDCGGALVLGFRGTQSEQDYVTDAEVWKTPLGSEHVHHGFNAAVDAVFPQILAATKSLSDLGRGPFVVPLFVTGHSLGGAMAFLAALRLAKLQFPVHAVYTFGQPRTGDSIFAADYDAALRDASFRFVNQEDAIPALPPWGLGYRHCGVEVFMPSGGGYVIDPSGWQKAGSKISGFCGATFRGSFAPLANHHLASYAEKINALT